MWRRIARVPMAVALFGGLIVGAPADASTLGEADGFHCELLVGQDTFDIDWTAADGEVDRYVIERKVYDRYWWRGRTSADERNFEDAPAPQTAAKALYRVAAVAADGTVLARTDCDLASDDMRCVVTSTSEGVDIRVTELLSIAESENIDYVLRRSVGADGPSSWRARSDGPVMVDTPSSSPDVTYTVWARVDRQIAAAADCVIGEVGGSGGLGEVSLFEACAEPLDTTERPSGVPLNGDAADVRDEILAIEPTAEQLRLAADGRVYFLSSDETRGGLATIAVYSPTTGEVRDVRQLEYVPDRVDLWHVDAVGGIYYHPKRIGGSYYLTPSGELVTLGFESISGDVDTARPIGAFADGTTLRSAIRGSGWFRSIGELVVFDPFTGESYELAYLSEATIALGLDDEGRILIGRYPSVGSEANFFAATLECVEGATNL